ncbi:MAG TPA: hypothetical protein VK504_22095 [Vicinamibacterales bacterium]|jgi:hypothetical protein|nr:hypothetical protein [Vicinamibacterales bacterium]
MDVETAEAIATLGDRIDALLVALRSDCAETRRHAEMLFESLKDDIRILAEGFATLSAKLDSRHG